MQLGDISSSRQCKYMHVGDNVCILGIFRVQDNANICILGIFELQFEDNICN